MIKEYDCPYTKFHIKGKEQTCPYCKNHGFRLAIEANEEGIETHLQISNIPCPSCEGIGYIIEEEQIVKRFGKTRKIIREFKIMCDDCLGYKNVLNVINFHECTYKTEDDEICTNGKVSTWIKASYNAFEVLFWIDIFFKKNIQEQVLADCPKCHGMSVIEEYKNFPSKKAITKV